MTRAPDRPKTQDDPDKPDKPDMRPSRDPGTAARRDRNEVRPNFKQSAGAGPGGKNVPEPETLALLALAHVVSDENLLPRFLALSGIAPDELRGRAQDPVLLGAVLDFLLAHEPDLVAFAAAYELPPAAIVTARRVLPGGHIDD